MHDLSIRKVPGIGRVNERLLESVGIKVLHFHVVVAHLIDVWIDLRGCLHTPCYCLSYGQMVGTAVPAQYISWNSIQRGTTLPTRGTEEHWGRTVGAQ